MVNETPTPASNAPAQTQDKAAADAAPAQAAAEAPAAPAKAGKAISGLKKLGLWSQLGEILDDLFSPDRDTRRMARYFLLSILGIFGVLVASALHFKTIRDQVASDLTSTGEQGKNLGDFIAKQAAQARLRYSVQPLGSFTIQIKAPDGPDGKPPKRLPGVMNLADIDIVLACDSKATCDFVEDRMPQIRNLVTDIFVPMDRDVLLSREGKKQLKQKIIQKINAWLPQGKIQDLYFDKLVIS